MSLKTLLVAALLATASSSPAVAAVARCDLILDEAMRQNCVERAQRCEPIRNAVERDACYRGPRSVRGRAGDEVSTATAPTDRR